MKTGKGDIINKEEELILSKISKNEIDKESINFESNQSIHTSSNNCIKIIIIIDEDEGDAEEKLDTKLINNPNHEIIEVL